MLTEFEHQVRKADGQRVLTVKDASEWMQEPAAEPDYVFKGLFDAGDKVVCIGASKSRKSFFLLQAILCLAAGRPFLNWEPSAPRRVLLTQFEIKESHFHRRLVRMAKALSISPEVLGDRLQIVNARGGDLSGKDLIHTARSFGETIKPAVFCFDPLYRLVDGDENTNGPDGMKSTLAMLDTLAEDFGATILYTHHDAKGAAGARALTDRGAGAGVLGRDYDTSIILTPHSSEEDAYVVETVIRNYPPQEPLAIRWTNQGDGYCFTPRPELAPTKLTSRTKKISTPLSEYLPSALAILQDDEMTIAEFKQVFKARTGLGDNRIRDFLNWTTAGTKPAFVCREERGFQRHQKWIRHATYN